MYMVSKVDTSIPPTTAVPMAIRWLAPSPVANASGIKSQYGRGTCHQNGAQDVAGRHP